MLATAATIAAIVALSSSPGTTGAGPGPVVHGEPCDGLPDVACSDEPDRCHAGLNPGRAGVVPSTDGDPLGVLDLAGALGAPGGVLVVHDQRVVAGGSP